MAKKNFFSWKKRGNDENDNLGNNANPEAGADLLYNMPESSEQNLQPLDMFSDEDSAADGFAALIQDDFLNDNGGSFGNDFQQMPAQGNADDFFAQNSQQPVMPQGDDFFAQNAPVENFEQSGDFFAQQEQQNAMPQGDDFFAQANVPQTGQEQAPQGDLNSFFAQNAPVENFDQSGDFFAQQEQQNIMPQGDDFFAQANVPQTGQEQAPQGDLNSFFAQNAPVENFEQSGDFFAQQEQQNIMPQGDDFFAQANVPQTEQAQASQSELDDFFAQNLPGDVQEPDEFNDFFAQNGSETAMPQNDDFFTQADAPQMPEQFQSQEQQEPIVQNIQDDFFAPEHPMQQSDSFFAEGELTGTDFDVAEEPFDIAVPETPKQEEEPEEEQEEYVPKKKFAPVFTHPIPSALDELRSGKVKPASPITAIAATQIPVVITAAEQAEAEAEAKLVAERVAEEAARAEEEARIAAEQAFYSSNYGYHEPTPEEMGYTAQDEYSAQPENLTLPVTDNFDDNGDNLNGLNSEQTTANYNATQESDYMAQDVNMQGEDYFAHSQPVAQNDEGFFAQETAPQFGQEQQSDDFFAQEPQFGEAPQFGTAPQFGQEQQSDDFFAQEPQFGEAPQFETAPQFGQEQQSGDFFAQEPQFGEAPQFDTAPQFGQEQQSGDFFAQEPQFGEAPQFETAPQFGTETAQGTSTDAFVDNFDSMFQNDSSFDALDSLDNNVQFDTYNSGDVQYVDASGTQGADNLSAGGAVMGGFDQSAQNVNDKFDNDIMGFSDDSWMSEDIGGDNTYNNEQNNFEQDGEPDKKKKGKINLPLVIILIVLVVAIIGGIIFIVLNGIPGADTSESVPSSSEQSTSQSTSESEPAEVVPAVDPIPRDEWYLKLVNKENVLDSSFTIDTATVGGQEVDARIAEALEQMIDAGNATGLDLIVQSGYRTYARQETNYDYQVSQQVAAGLSQAEAEAAAALITAPPGTSEHNLGLGVDIMSSDNNDYSLTFADTDEAKWLLENAATYGFILRYPEGKDSITGFAYEPWHYRYVGVDQAQKIVESGLTLEEYLAQDIPTGIPSEQTDTAADGADTAQDADTDTSDSASDESTSADS